MEAELALFEKASHTPHSYYHLLSGIDLPLHGQDFIHQYFEGKNQEYIGFAKNWDVRGRVFCHNILMAHMRQPNRYAQFLLVKLRIWFNKLQMSLGYRVPQPNLTYKAGSSWVSVTHDFVVSLLEKKCELLTMYRYACCPDEIYKHTFAFNSGFKDRIAKEGSLREIDWNRGTPYIWRNEDYDYLSKSKCLFARKFDGKVDSEIINRILAKINE